MVVRLRLARGGARHAARYRIVAAEARTPRDGRFLEILGAYNPHAYSRAPEFNRIKRVYLNVPRIRYWMSVGAHPSDTVARLLGMAGVLERSPRVVVNKEDLAEGDSKQKGLAQALE